MAHRIVVITKKKARVEHGNLDSVDGRIKGLLLGGIIHLSILVAIVASMQAWAWAGREYWLKIEQLALGTPAIEVEHQLGMPAERESVTKVVNGKTQRILILKYQFFDTDASVWVDESSGVIKKRIDLGRGWR